MAKLQDGGDPNYLLSGGDPPSGPVYDVYGLVNLSPLCYRHNPRVMIRAEKTVVFRGRSTSHDDE